MTTLFDDIQELRALYPGSLSAVMPALQLAQEQNDGWLSEQAFRDVADTLDLTPAYCLSIASFYDMFRLAPVGQHVIEVCTNISCGLNGAQDVVDAFEAELGLKVGDTNEEFTLRTVECLGGCGWATIVAVNNRHRLRVSAEDVPAIVAEIQGRELVAPSDEPGEEASGNLDS